MYDKRYVENFLIWKPKEFRDDFEHFLPFIESDFINQVSEKFKPKFGERYIGVIINGTYTNIVGINTHHFFTKTIKTTEYMTIRRDFQISQII